MKTKTLIPLVVIVVILGALVAVKQSQDQPQTITDQVKLDPLLPADLDTAAVTKLVAYTGAKPDEKVILAKSDDGWVVETHFNAPAKKVEVDKLVGTLQDLQGELRANADDGALDSYEITDAQGYHVLGYTGEGGSNEAFHVVTGKAPTFGHSFVRSSDSGTIYVANVDLRRETGILTMKADDAPTADKWLDKQVVAVESDDVARIALSYPDKQLTLAKEVHEAVMDTGEDTDGDAEDAPEEQPVEADPVTETVASWAVAEGGPGLDLIEQPITSMLNRLVSLNAANIVDPAKAAEYGLDATEYRLELILKGQDEPVILEAAPTETRDKAYARLAGGNTVYEIRTYDFDQIFPSGDAFFELPGLLLDDGILSRIEYNVGDTNVVLTRPGGEWALEQPATDIAKNLEAMNAVERVLASFKPADYADSAEGTGLDNPSHTVTFSGAGNSHTIELGNESEHTPGRYARLDGSSRVWVMSEGNVDTAFASPSALLDPMVVTLEDGEEIESITVTKGEDAFTLALENALWMLKHGDATVEADELLADDIAAALSGLEADEFIFADARAPGDILGTVQFTTSADRAFSLTVEAEQDGRHVVSMAGKNTPFYVASAFIDRIFADPVALNPASGDAEAAEDDAAPDEAEVTQE